MRVFLLLVLFFIKSLLTAQFFEPCGFDTYLTELNAKIPGTINKLNADLEAKVKYSKFKKRANSLDTVYEIRVVFHVVYANANQNIPDSCLQSQLTILNEAFSHTHEDSGTVVPYFLPFVGKSNLIFKLATEDPNGNPTNGITRTFTNSASFGANSSLVKYSGSGGQNAWNTDKYLNIWVCNFEFNSSTFLLGIATPPNQHPFWLGTGNENIVKQEQGVSLHYKIVGKNNPSFTSIIGQSNKGKTAIHEVGHYLGLRHIWGDANASNRCIVDDYIDDTPLQRSSSSFTCNLLRNTCNSGANDAVDNVENYMDYATEDCNKMFTKRQMEVMLLSLITSRNGIISKKTPLQPTIVASKPSFRWNNGNLVFLNDEKNAYKVKVYDMAGRQIYLNDNLNTLDLFDFKRFAKGTYIVKFFQKDNIKKSFSQKILL